MGGIFIKIKIISKIPKNSLFLTNSNKQNKEQFNNNKDHTSFQDILNTKIKRGK